MLNKLILVLSLLFITFLSFGQDPLDDFWKDVERRKSLKKKTLSDQSFRYDSLIVNHSGHRIFFVKQDYIYEKKNKRYVRENDDYYGRSYGIGVAVSNGILTSNHLRQPWKNDNSSLPDKGYIPVLTNLSYKSLNDTVSTMRSEEQFAIETASELISYTYDDFTDSGSEYASPDSVGLLVLFYHDKLKDSIWKKSFPINKQWHNGVAELDTQVLKHDLIGGVFFNMDSSQQKCSLQLSGILGEDKTGEFKLLSITNNIHPKPKSKTDPKIKNKSTLNVDRSSKIQGRKNLKSHIQ